MKKLLVPAVLISIMVFGCKKDDPTGNNDTNNSEVKWETGNVVPEIQGFLEDNSPPIHTAKIDATSGGIVSSNNIHVTFMPGSFATLGGQVYTGEVTLKMQTVKNISDMIYSGITTTANNGELLISDGMFKIEAYDSANAKLQLSTGSSYMAQMPSFNDSNKVFRGVNRGSRNNGVSWAEWTAGRTKQDSLGTIVSGLDSLFVFCNLDRYMNLSPLTDLTVSVPAGFSNANTVCIIRYDGENAVAYLGANPTLQAFSTVGGYYKVVANSNIHILCIAKKDNKFYYAKLSKNSLGTNETLAITAMIETTEPNLKTQIAGF